MKLHYEVHGEGKALILVPGFASGAWIWRWQTRELSKWFRVITFDPRGVAKSAFSNGDNAVSIPLIADDIAALLDDLGIDRANILGVSFGGFVAQEFALSYPSRTDKLILGCTSYGGPGHVPPAPEVLASFTATEGLNSSERICKFMRPAFTEDFLRDHGATVKEVCRLREENVVPESVYMQQLIAATTFDSKDRLSELVCETMILSGDADQVVPMQNSVNLAVAIPVAKLEIVAGGSHMFFVEQPDDFNRIVRNFIGS
jgi:pimeloyl-ACP methyl ester carboxylesterase